MSVGDFDVQFAWSQSRASIKQLELTRARDLQHLATGKRACAGNNGVSQGYEGGIFHGLSSQVCHLH
jgi:hypothetical protein